MMSPTFCHASLGKVTKSPAITQFRLSNLTQRNYNSCLALTLATLTTKNWNGLDAFAACWRPMFKPAAAAVPECRTPTASKGKQTFGAYSTENGLSK